MGACMSTPAAVQLPTTSKGVHVECSPNSNSVDCQAFVHDCKEATGCVLQPDSRGRCSHSTDSISGAPYEALLQVRHGWLICYQNVMLQSDESDCQCGRNIACSLHEIAQQQQQLPAPNPVWSCMGARARCACVLVHGTAPFGRRTLQRDLLQSTGMQA